MIKQSNHSFVEFRITLFTYRRTTEQTDRLVTFKQFWFMTAHVDCRNMYLKGYLKDSNLLYLYTECIKVFLEIESCLVLDWFRCWMFLKQMSESRGFSEQVIGRLFARGWGAVGVVLCCAVLSQVGGVFRQWFCVWVVCCVVWGDMSMSSCPCHVARWIFSGIFLLITRTVQYCSCRLQ